MSGEKNDNPNEEKDPLEVDDTNDYDDLDDILNDDEDDKGKGAKSDTKDEDGSSEKNKNENKKDGENDNKFYKKVGNREFSSSEDYDKFVLEQYHTNSRFAGEIKKLGGDPKTISKALDDVDDGDGKEKQNNQEKKELSDEERYYRIEAIRFTKQFPTANDYKDEMQVFIRKGKANINGEPSYALALAKSLRADGQAIPQRLLDRIRVEKGGDDEARGSRSASKRVMKSGGSNSNSAPSQETYSDDDMGNLSDFGNKIASGSIRSF